MADPINTHPSVVNAGPVIGAESAADRFKSQKREGPYARRKEFQLVVMTTFVGVLLSWGFCPQVEGQSVTATVPVGSGPTAVAVNATTNKVYVANQSGGTVTVIDGATNTTTSITAAQNTDAIAVNATTNKIYINNYGLGGPSVSAPGSVMVIDGATNATTTIPLSGVGAVGIAVNPVTNKIYAGTSNLVGSNSVVIIDGATNATTSVTVPNEPRVFGVNTVTNKIYALNTTQPGNGDVAVIDGATGTVTTNIGVGFDANAIAVNETTNTIYVLNPNSFGTSTISVIDGSTDSISATINLPGGSPSSLAVNSTTNRVYVDFSTNSGPVVEVIDGSTNNAIASVSTSTPLGQMLINNVTNTIYQATNPVLVIDGSTSTATTTIAVGAGAGAGAVNTMTDYVYIANTSGNTVSVINGAPAGPAFSASPSPLAFGNQTEGTTSAALTLTVTNSGTTDLSITNVAAGGTDSGDFPISSDGCMGASVAAGKTCTVSVKFAPATTAAESATLTFTDNASDSPQVVNLTGKGVAPVATASTTALSASANSIAAGTSITFTATITPTSGTPTPTGTVTFKNGSTTLGTGTLNSSGVATYATSSLAEGVHSITASYGGDARNLASTSSAVSVTVAAAPTTTTMTASGTSVVVGANVTFTANVTGGTGSLAPTGTVTFNDGTTTLGTGAVNGSGVATYSTTALAAGSHSVTANYGGDTNNAASTSTAATLTVWPGPADFTVSLSPASVSFKAGTKAVTTVTIASVNGFNSATNLTISGLPKNSTGTFSSSSVTPTVSGTATSTLTILTDTKATAAMEQGQFKAGPRSTGRASSMALAGLAGFVLLLPLLGAKHRALRRVLSTLSALVLLALISLGGMSACGGGPTTPKGTYSVQLTATAGSNTHSATFSLTVQ